MFCTWFKIGHIVFETLCKRSVVVNIQQEDYLCNELCWSADAIFIPLLPYALVPGCICANTLPVISERINSMSCGQHGIYRARLAINIIGTNVAGTDIILTPGTEKGGSFLISL